MPNYSGFQPSRPFSSFIEGLGAGQQFQYSGLHNEALQAASDRQKLQRETAQQFAATGDPRVLRGYDPGLAVTIENNLATMDTNKQQATIKRLTAGIDITDKALPYIVAASRSNPQAAANMWPEYIADLRKVGIQPPPFMEQFSPEVLEGVLKQKEDIATTVARITANKPVSVRPGGAIVSPVTGKAIYQQPAEPKTYKPEAFTGPNGEVQWVEPGKPVPSGFTKVGTAKTVWGSMAAAAKAGNWDEFSFYQTLWNQQHPGTRPQLFKSVTGNNYRWVTPAEGQEPPAGFRPVTEDAFKALLGSLAGNAVPAPTDDVTPRPPSSAGSPSSSGQSLQERAAAELARRKAGQR